MQPHYLLHINFGQSLKESVFLIGIKWFTFNQIVNYHLHSIISCSIFGNLTIRFIKIFSHFCFDIGSLCSTLVNFLCFWLLNILNTCLWILPHLFLFLFTKNANLNSYTSLCYQNGPCKEYAEPNLKLYLLTPGCLGLLSSPYNTRSFMYKVPSYLTSKSFGPSKFSLLFVTSSVLLWYNKLHYWNKILWWKCNLFI